MMLRVPIFSSVLLLFSTLLLYSCITIDKTMGENLIPADQDLTLNLATFDLPIDSRLIDSLPTNNHYFAYDIGMPLLFGACYDPLFGLTEAGTAFQFFPYNSFSYGDNPEPISLTLTLIRSKNIVLDQGQLSIPQNIFVHEINTEFSYKNAYNNSLLPDDWDHVPVSQHGQLYFGGDTVTVALSLDFARKLLTTTQEEKDSALLFVKRFKGLYLRSELPDEGINKGRLNFVDFAYMSLRYSLEGADSIVTYVGGSSYGYAFNSIRHSRAVVDPHPSQHIYYQGFAGYKPYIDFVAMTQKIRLWAEQSKIDLKQLLLSRAEVILSYDPNIDYTSIDQYPLMLYPYVRNHSDTTSYYLPINDVYAANANGSINRSKYQYSMNITSYLQSLLKKEQVTEQDNTWLMETANYEDPNYGTISYLFSATTYPLATFKGTATDAKPVLKITYSVLK